MHFKQFYEPGLGHVSYLLGSEETGEALVLDVRRDVEDYYDFARGKGLRITYAADTHQHNDYLTGITQLEGRDRILQVLLRRQAARSVLLRRPGWKSRQSTPRDSTSTGPSGAIETPPCRADQLYVMTPFGQTIHQPPQGHGDAIELGSGGLGHDPHQHGLRHASPVHRLQMIAC